MHRRNFLFLSAGATVLGWTGWRLQSVTSLNALVARGDLRKFNRRGFALGTQVDITAYHPAAQVAQRGVDAAFAAIERVESVMSLFRPDSALSRLNAAGRLDQPDAELVRVLRYAAELAERTDGRFDVTVQPLWRCYQHAAEQGGLPTAEALAAARALVDWRGLRVDDDQVVLARPGMAVTLNGIAQGLAADAAAAALRAEGVEHALVDSGEFGVVGDKPGQGAWRIGLKHPRAREQLLGLSALDGRCLATSGDYETFFSADFRFNHLIDPRTGRSPDELASVSVVAPTALEADALSTAVYLLGREQGEHLLAQLEQVDALFVEKSGRVSRTSAFPFERMS